MGDEENTENEDAETVAPPDGGDAADGPDATETHIPTPEDNAGAHSLDLREIRSEDQEGGGDGEGSTQELEIGGMEFELEDAVDFEIPERPGSAADLEALYDIPVQLAATLGMTTLQVDELLKLGRGAVVELDRKVGEAIDIYVNNRLVARGEVVVVDDKLGVTMTEIIKTGNN